jgi:hypothetical protein
MSESHEMLQSGAFHVIYALIQGVFALCSRWGFWVCKTFQQKQYVENSGANDADRMSGSLFVPR